MQMHMHMRTHIHMALHIDIPLSNIIQELGFLAGRTLAPSPPPPPSPPRPFGPNLAFAPRSKIAPPSAPFRLQASVSHKLHWMVLLPPPSQLWVHCPLCGIRLTREIIDTPTPGHDACCMSQRAMYPQRWRCVLRWCWRYFVWRLAENHRGREHHGGCTPIEMISHHGG